MKRPERFLAAAFPILCLWIIASPHLYSSMLEWRIFTTANGSFSFLVRHLIRPGIILLPPTLLLGGIFPVIVSAAGGTTSVVVGRLYAANCLGNLFGVAATTFVLLPNLGLRDTGWALGGVFLAATAVIIARRPRIIFLAVAIAAVAITHSFLPPREDFSRDFFRILYDKAEEVQVWEGASGIATMEPAGDVWMIRFNGRIEGKIPRHPRTDLLNWAAKLPAMIHEAPEEALVIGVGGGTSVTQLLPHGANRVRCVEISPEMLAAARTAHEREGLAFDDPRLTWVIADGRMDLLARPDRYDLILLNPIRTFGAGGANLSSVEFYRLCRERLDSGGVITQYFSVYDDARASLIIRTFLSVFPEAEMWSLGDASVLMRGAMLVARKDGPLSPDLRIDTALAAYAPEIRPRRRATPEELRRQSGEGPLNRDDRPLSEYYLFPIR